MDIDRIIQILEQYIIENNMCVFPDKQTFDCCDCTICRIDFFKHVIQDLTGNEYW